MVTKWVRGSLISLSLIVALMRVSALAQDEPASNVPQIGPTPTAGADRGNDPGDNDDRLPQIGGTATPDDADYASPTYGFTFSWSDDWTLGQDVKTGDVEGVYVSNGVTLVFVLGGDAAGSASRARLDGCLGDLVNVLRTDLALTELTVATDGSGATLSGAEAGNPWIVYTGKLSTDSTLGSAGDAVAAYLECRPLADPAALLTIVALTPLDRFNTEIAAVRDLLTGIETGVPSPGAGASGDACAGFDAWLTDAQARLDAAGAIDPFAVQAGKAVDAERFAAQALELGQEQARAATPAAAEAAQAKLLSYYDALVNAWTLRADAIRGDELASINAITAEAFAASEGALASVEISKAEASCGGTGTGADGAPDPATEEARTYPCPPDARKIAEWRQNAADLRETADESTSPTNQTMLRATADQWDDMADEWEGYCLTSGV